MDFASAFYSCKFLGYVNFKFTLKFSYNLKLINLYLGKIIVNIKNPYLKGILL